MNNSTYYVLYEWRGTANGEWYHARRTYTDYALAMEAANYLRSTDYPHVSYTNVRNVELAIRLDIIDGFELPKPDGRQQKRYDEK